MRCALPASAGSAYPSSRQLLSIDVMDRSDGRFICTLRKPHSPLFKLDVRELIDFVYQKRPTLRYRKIQLFVDCAGSQVTFGNDMVSI